jgi:hypothetical protein
MMRNEQIVRDMADRIVAVVGERDYVTFTELMRELGNDARGEISLVLQSNPNLILWGGISETFPQAFRLAWEQLELHPSSFLLYAIDGGWMTYPIAKRNRAYKKPHWLSVTLRPRDPKLRKRYGPNPRNPATGKEEDWRLAASHNFTSPPAPYDVQEGVVYLNCESHPSGRPVGWA